MDKPKLRSLPTRPATLSDNSAEGQHLAIVGSLLDYLSLLQRYSSKKNLINQVLGQLRESSQAELNYALRELPGETSDMEEEVKVYDLLLDWLESVSFAGRDQAMEVLAGVRSATLDALAAAHKLASPESQLQIRQKLEVIDLLLDKHRAEPEELVEAKYLLATTRHPSPHPSLPR